MHIATTATRALALAVCVLATDALRTALPLAAQTVHTVQAMRPWQALETAQAMQPVQDTARRNGGWTTLRVAKWTTAAAATSLAVYGVVNNRQADRRFEELEQLCVAAPLRCDERQPDGSYMDPELENHYQDIRRLDYRARTALLAGQVGIAASVLLFVLDLRNSGGPENIPYEPRTFDAGRSRDGGLSLQFNLKVPGGL